MTSGNCERPYPEIAGKYAHLFDAADGTILPQDKADAAALGKVLDHLPDFRKMMEELAIAEGRLPGDIEVRATGTHDGSTWGDITASSGSSGSNGGDTGSGNNIPGNTSRGSLLGDGDEPAAIGHNQPPETVTPSKQESSRDLENDNNTEIPNPDPTDADRDLLSASLEDMYPPGTLSAAKIWKAKNSGQSGWPTTPGQNSLCSAPQLETRIPLAQRTA